MINRSEAMPLKVELHFLFQPKKKTHLLKKALTRPPSRNESFIWQIRTYLEKDEFAEAAGLIETLKIGSAVS